MESSSSWLLTNDAERKRLERVFKKRSIDFSAPGFCDSPAFLKEEQQNARFLETYARFIEVQAYSPEYCKDVRRKIATAAEVVRAAVETDGRQGACVDASGMLGRMLDRLGVWNYVAKSTLTIDFPPNSGLDQRFFWVLDEGNFVAPHAIVVAPPYGVVDVTVKYQPYDAEQVALLPDWVLADHFEIASWKADDLANDELRDYLHSHRIEFGSFLQRRYFHMYEVMKALPPRQVMINDVRLKYVIIAIGGFIEQLEDVTGYKPSGRTALQLYEEEVLPRLADIPGHTR